MRSLLYYEAEGVAVIVAVVHHTFLRHLALIHTAFQCSAT
jgi:hypothetical protein